MQLSQFISLLLASVLLAISFNFADARPIFLSSRNVGKLITLPVKRYDHKDISDVHPLIVRCRSISCLIDE